MKLLAPFLLLLMSAALPAQNPAFPDPALTNPVWTSKDNLRDPAVHPVEGGYRIFYSRLSSPKSGWGDPKNWSIGSVFTKDFLTFEDDHDISPKGYASPGDVIFWHGRWVIPYQTYPKSPARLVFSESKDLKTWSEPRMFLEEAASLAWNQHRRLIDATFVIEGDVLHCFFVGSKSIRYPDGSGGHANLLGHAITRDPELKKWEILTQDEPIFGTSEEAPDGVENIAIFRTGDHWTMLYSKGLRDQRLALAESKDLRSWTSHGFLEIPRQGWMALRFGAPFVWWEKDRFWMILMGESKAAWTTFGLFHSEDGKIWTPLPEKP